MSPSSMCFFPLLTQLYISEMSHERVRGTLGSCVQLMVVLGIMGVYLGGMYAQLKNVSSGSEHLKSLRGVCCRACLFYSCYAAHNKLQNMHRVMGSAFGLPPLLPGLNFLFCGNVAASP